MIPVPARRRGFTLIELTAVLVVLGILLVIAAPRMDGGNAVREVGYGGQLLSDLRSAQQRAQADGCEVRVAVTATAVTIRQRAALCSGAFNQPVAAPGPSGTAVGEPPPEGMALSATPAVFYFDALGRALDSAGGTPVDVSITVGARQLDVVGATGHAGF